MLKEAEKYVVHFYSNKKNDLEIGKKWLARTSSFPSSGELLCRARSDAFQPINRKAKYPLTWKTRRKKPRI